MSTPAPGELELVRGFVNTWDAEDQTETFSSPGALCDWLAEHELLDAGEGAVTASDADVAHARELRDALRSMLRANHGEPVDPAATPRVEAAARRSRLAVRFVGEGGSVQLQPLAGGVDGALGRVLARMAVAMADGTWQRLKVCPADDCQWAFYDTSRNRSAVWCDMKVCGNRAKVRSFRERRGPAGEHA
jgi:predicted RNA-binding Zn ribbon-like protein